jgi:hypothetical protein
MIEELRTRVAKRLEELDGVIGLQQTSYGTAPYLFRDGDDLIQMVLEPRYPLAEITSKLQKRFRDANLGIVARGCDTRALVEMVKRHQIDPDHLYLIGISCTAEQAELSLCKPCPRCRTVASSGIDWGSCPRCPSQSRASRIQEFVAGRALGILARAIRQMY